MVTYTCPSFSSARKSRYLIRISQSFCCQVPSFGRMLPGAVPGGTEGGTGVLVLGGREGGAGVLVLGGGTGVELNGMFVLGRAEVGGAGADPFIAWLPTVVVDEACSV